MQDSCIVSVKRDLLWARHSQQSRSRIYPHSPRAEPGPSNTYISASSDAASQGPRELACIFRSISSSGEATVKTHTSLPHVLRFSACPRAKHFVRMLPSLTGSLSTKPAGWLLHLPVMLSSKPRSLAGSWAVLGINDQNRIFSKDQSYFALITLQPSLLKPLLASPWYRNKGWDQCTPCTCHSIGQAYFPLFSLLDLSFPLTSSRKPSGVFPTRSHPPFYPFTLCTCWFLSACNRWIFALLI